MFARSMRERWARRAGESMREKQRERSQSRSRTRSRQPADPTKKLSHEEDMRGRDDAMQAQRRRGDKADEAAQAPGATAAEAKRKRAAAGDWLERAIGSGVAGDGHNVHTRASNLWAMPHVFIWHTVAEHLYDWNKVAPVKRGTRVAVLEMEYPMRNGHPTRHCFYYAAIRSTSTGECEQVGYVPRSHTLTADDYMAALNMGKWYLADVTGTADSESRARALDWFVDSKQPVGAFVVTIDELHELPEWAHGANGGDDGKAKDVLSKGPATASGGSELAALNATDYTPSDMEKRHDVGSVSWWSELGNMLLSGGKGMVEALPAALRWAIVGAPTDKHVQDASDMAEELAKAQQAKGATGTYAFTNYRLFIKVPDDYESIVERRRSGDDDVLMAPLTAAECCTKGGMVRRVTTLQITRDVHGRYWTPHGRRAHTSLTRAVLSLARVAGPLLPSLSGGPAGVPRGLLEPPAIDNAVDLECEQVTGEENTAWTPSHDFDMIVGAKPDINATEQRRNRRLWIQENVGGFERYVMDNLDDCGNWWPPLPAPPRVLPGVHTLRRSRLVPPCSNEQDDEPVVV